MRYTVLLIDDPLLSDRLNRVYQEFNEADEIIVLHRGSPSGRSEGKLRFLPVNKRELEEGMRYKLIVRLGLPGSQDKYQHLDAVRILGNDARLTNADLEVIFDVGDSFETVALFSPK